MQKDLAEIVLALDQLAKAVLAAWSDDRSLTEVYGWHHPALTRQNIAGFASRLAERIRSCALSELDEKTIAQVRSSLPKLELLKANVLPYMFNGNGHQAIPAYIATLQWIEDVLRGYFQWQPIDTKALPAPMARKLRSVQAELDQLIPDKEIFLAQVEQIRAATEAAENLPINLLELGAAKKKVDKLAAESIELVTKISLKRDESDENASRIAGKRDEADRLVAQCEDAYKITTTKGLAAAFDQRAVRLSGSMWIWVAGLLAALVTGSVLGTQRISVLTSALASTDPNWAVIWMNAVLSLLSVSAPLWFAWLATKQIGQRFRLAEDYAFKASVAKAYEGYRKEASRLDKAFEARLFASALDRLEEAPLRLISADEHGSPWHEAAKSSALKNIRDTVPMVRDAAVRAIKKSSCT